MKNNPKTFNFALMKWLFLLIPAIFSFAQSGSTRWQDHFSYNNIRHIWEINGLIFCSAENGIFSYDPVSGETQKISKVTQLNDVDITAFSYNPENEVIFIGYRSGELDILTPDGNHNFLEVPLHQGYTGSKIINHITIFQNTAVISGEWGLVTFDLESLEFMETTYFVQAGTYFGVKESAVFDGSIYAASDRGIFTHPLNGLIANFTNWQQPAGLPVSGFQNIINFQGKLLTNSGSNIYSFDGSGWNSFTNITDICDISANGNILSVTQSNTVINYDENLSQIESVSFSEILNTGIKSGNVTYGGSQLVGLLAGANEIRPDGPYSNKSWTVTALNGQIWIAPGGMVDFNNVQQNADGYSHFDETSWIHVKSEDILNAKDIVHIEVNPQNPSEVYVSSWFEHPSWGAGESIHIGMFKMVNDAMVEHYNSENSGLKFQERIAGSKLDENGNLWVSQAFVRNPNPWTNGVAKKTSSGNWTFIDIGGDVSQTGVNRPMIYQDHAWIPLTRGGGLKVTDMENVYTISTTANMGNLPSASVITVAFDESGTLWIGTNLGLRILYNPLEAVLSGNFETQPIIIEQNGIPEALLMDTQINDIEVDGANRKWIATETSGVYYVSESGEETIFNFTVGNSPLPSNKVNDVTVDKSTGIVYFATDKGVVSYRSDAVDVGDSFGDVYSYPNPVRPGFTGNVTIKGLPNDADVRIVDVVGNLIYNTKAAGGVVQWDTKNLKGKPVASGIYLVLMSNRDASETKQTKIAIVR